MNPMISVFLDVGCSFDVIQVLHGLLWCPNSHEPEQNGQCVINAKHVMRAPAEMERA